MEVASLNRSSQPGGGEKHLKAGCLSHNTGERVKAAMPSSVPILLMFVCLFTTIVGKCF